MPSPMDSSALKPFPSARRMPALTEELRASDVELPPASAADIPFLLTLYRASRLAELLMTPWPAERKQAFLDDQFALQHSHFLKVHRKGDYRVVIQAGRSVGRIYCDRSARDWRLIDILLSKEAQGKGIGSALIRWMQHSALVAGTAQLRLSVAHDNPRARVLYDRLGFLETEVGATHTGMVWNGNGRSPSRKDSGREA
jgi:RimJ/RimL family protein N-acetyltransferase